MSETLENIQLPVDRPRALVRGLWRLATAILLAGATLQADLQWGLLWQTHRATFVALGLLFLFMDVAALILFITAVRWLLLVCWPAETGIEITPAAVSMKLGPFGRSAYDWSGIETTIGEDFNWDLFEMMPGDTVAPSVRHRDCDEDLLFRVQKFARVESDALMTAIRPYLKRALSDRAVDENAG